MIKSQIGFKFNQVLHKEHTSYKGGKRGHAHPDGSYKINFNKAVEKHFSISIL